MSTALSAPSSVPFRNVHASPPQVEPASLKLFSLPEETPVNSCSCITDEIEYLQITLVILDVLETFGTHTSKGSSSGLQSRWIGKAKFLPHVFHHVRRHEPVQLTMPAFPCKSANRENKVLGHLPDLGEELGLCRLNDIAVAIGQVYHPGATVNIVSDGILFNDVIGVSDCDTWEYGQELRAIITEKKLDHVAFVRPQVMLGMVSEQDLTKEKYIETAEECRTLLEAQYGSTIKQIESLITSDKDTNATYCGMVKFLETELFGALVGKSYNKRRKIQKDTAKKMMQRSEAFTLAIRTLRPLEVRLSMHPSSGESKLSVALVPSSLGFFQKSPWHSCVAIDKNGDYHCVHSDEVRETHQLMYKGGRPYFYMAKEAFDLGTPEMLAIDAFSVEAVSEVPSITDLATCAQIIPEVALAQVATVPVKALDFPAEDSFQRSLTVCVTSIEQTA